MEIQKIKGRKRMLIMGTVGILCLAVVMIFAMTANSSERKLTRQLELGKKYLLEADYEQAITTFDLVIEIDPKNADAYLGKSDACIGMGDVAVALKVLEAGYLATEENEAIGDKLTSLYLDVVEEAVKDGTYEEGRRAYERIVELGSENEELRKKLEMLSDQKNEEDSEEKTTERAEEQEIPYYELGFSPEDFMLAGYSILDGNHIDDIEEAAEIVMPETHNISGAERIGDYIGWSYERWDKNTLKFAYCGNESYAFVDNLYVFYDGGYNRISVDSNNGELPVNEFSLFKGNVNISETSRENALDILGIKQIVQQTNEKGGYFEFESQYGHTLCETWSDEKVEFHIEIVEEKWELSMGFYNDIVSYISIGREFY